MENIRANRELLSKTRQNFTQARTRARTQSSRRNIVRENMLANASSSAAYNCTTTTYRPRSMSSAFASTSSSSSSSAAALLRRGRSHHRGGRTTTTTTTKTAIIASSSSTTDEASKMVVSITGATGFVGTKLVESLLRDGHEVRVLTRSIKQAKKKLKPETLPKGTLLLIEPTKWPLGIKGSTHVVNLAGEPISTRWDENVKKEIMNSRVKATEAVVDAIANVKDESKRPKVLVTASAIGYYGTSDEETFDESSSSGSDYLSSVCRAWEKAAKKAEEMTNGETRVVFVRLGIVLDRDGGALGKMLPTFQLFMGGPIGDGGQWFSWIHRKDAVKIIRESLVNEELKGAINATAPFPVKMRDLTNSLGKELGRPSWMPVPDFALQALLGEGSSLVLQGQKVLPKELLREGYRFEYETISDALNEIVNE
jgi:uncharacterized protein (TIGR01777 family)